MAKKLKSHSGVLKRFKITKKNKVLSKKSCNNHLLTNKWDSNKKSPYGKVLSKTDSKMVKNLLPYK